jgi:hypothetical protein
MVIFNRWLYMTVGLKKRVCADSINISDSKHINQIKKGCHQRHPFRQK